MPVSLSRSLAILKNVFYPPGRGPGPPPQVGPEGARIGPPRPRGRLGCSVGVPTTWSLDRQAEVGNHFGHPQGVQVKALNSEFCFYPIQ